MFEQDLRTLSFVDRWGTVRRVVRQNVAEHMYYVSVYSVQIASRIGWRGKKSDLLLWALAHDAPECYSGDIQGPTKRNVVDADRLRAFESAEADRRFPNSFLSEYINNSEFLDPDVRRIVKCADIADEVAYLCIEMSMGNPSVHAILDKNVFPRFKAAWLDLPAREGIDLQEVWQTEVVPLFNDMAECDTRHMVR